MGKIETWRRRLEERDRRNKANQCKIRQSGNTYSNLCNGANDVITEAIDQWIEDNQLHGGAIADRFCVNGIIVADWGALVRQRMANKGLNGYGADGYTGDTRTTLADRMRKKMMLTDFDSSPERDAGEVNNIGHRRNNGDDDGPDDGDDHHGPGPRAPSGRRPRDQASIYAADRELYIGIGGLGATICCQCTRARAGQVTERHAESFRG